MSGGKKQVEIWKPIPEHDGYYASNMGRIKSIDRYDNRGTFRKGRVLKPYKNKQGYLLVGLSNNGKQRRFMVHRLVMLAFVGEPPEGHEVNHIDENPSNNRIDNLEYVTRRQNCNYGNHNMNLSRTLTGMKKSDEHKRHISEGRKGMTFSEEHKSNISKARRTHRTRRVRCVETGEVFDTIVDAQRACGMKSDAGIRHVCYGRRKTSGGYEWRFE